jgi:ligand-binding SRPBCC domain-containing protein
MISECPLLQNIPCRRITDGYFLPLQTVIAENGNTIRLTIMGLNTLTFRQCIPVSIEEAWEFFSDPANLARITPPEMFFRITSGTAGQQIYEGMLITYTLYPFMMLPVQWETEITKVDRPFLFEDRQKSGPYGSWRHRHQFREIPGGIEMTDRIDYSMPFGVFGDLVNALIVSRRLEEVFAYRKRKTGELLGVMNSASLHRHA